LILGGCFVNGKNEKWSKTAQQLPLSRGIYNFPPRGYDKKIHKL